jgi:hypothetical protein
MMNPSIVPPSFILPIAQPRAAKAQVQKRPLRPEAQRPVHDRR